MQTIISYKITYVDEYGCIVEMDFSDKQSAIDYAAHHNITNYELFEVGIIGQIKKL